MRLRVLGAMGVVCAVAVAAMLGAASARADGGSFELLTTAISGSDSLPAVQQTVFLQRVALAETFVSSSGPAFPPSPCEATGLIDSIGFTTRGLYAAGEVTADDALTLIDAVASVNDAIVSAYPPSPCSVAFLNLVPVDG